MKTVTGNLIEMFDQFDIIVHGCNCFNVMGAGIAPQINKAFSNVASIADATTIPGDIEKLGKVSVGRYQYFDMKQKANRILYIVNAYTQYGTARFPGDTVVNYDAIASCFKLVREIALSHRRSRVGYPQIGSGLAGGNWEIISKIIDRELEGINHTCVVYDGSLTPNRVN